ncbi:MAG TPA: T9SS type A sorting domain-containing protein [Puia sp.]|nr:T9SS type A sorting domain-containing protein [Puia sp.]
MQRVLLLGLRSGRLFFILFFQLFLFRTQAQTLTTVNYAGSGLTNTVGSNSSADVLAGHPVIGGYTHTTLSSLYQESFGNPTIVLTTNPPGFDGSVLYLGAGWALPYSQAANQYYNEFVTDAYSFNYTFVPGYSYYVTVNYGSSSTTYVPGIGMNIGSSATTQTFTQLGSAMVNQYTNYPQSAMPEGVNDPFLANPLYSSWLSVPGGSGFADVTMTPFTVNSNTTGLNLEALPTIGLIDGASYLKIGSVTIAGVPAINPVSGPICSSTTVSIPDGAGWPVSWSISPAIATLSPSGSSVTVSATGNGLATLTASLTGPDGRVYQSSMAIQIGTQDIRPVAPLGIVPGIETLPPNSPAEFVCTGANYWTATGGTIIGGQGTYNIDIQTDNSSAYLYVTAAIQNACGVGAGYTNSYPIQAGSSPGVSTRPSLSTGAGTTFKNDSLAGYATLFPNPATNIVQVNLPQTGFSRTSIRLYDVSGHLLRMIIPSGPTTRVDVSQWAAGTYFITIFDGQQQRTSKLIKQ